MKHTLKILSIILMIIAMTGCEKNSVNDEPETPNGLYDWLITKSYYSVEGSNSTLIKRENETLYNKSEEYVLEQKREFESHSTKFYRQKYAYSKIL